MFVPNFKFLSQVVSEKSLTEKVYTHTDTQTHKLTSVRKRQKLYTPYILRIPGVLCNRGYYEVDAIKNEGAKVATTFLPV